MPTSVPPLLAALAVAAVVCLVGALLLVVRRLARQRAELAETRTALAGLEDRLDRLGAEVEQSRRVREAAAETGYLITDAGVVRVDPTPEEEFVPSHVVVSGTVGETLVRAVSFSHGLAQALRPENRDRIRGEMRREVRRARKQRKEELREARRVLRAAQRRGVDLREAAGLTDRSGPRSVVDAA